MNDPWDVKSVRRSGQYLSCMKINGVPLLPPVLSKECRKEMQYYKLLAKEVEKRISMLQPYISDSETEISDDKTDAPELPENEVNSEITKEDIQPIFNNGTDVPSVFTKKLESEDKNDFSNAKLHTTDLYSSLQSNITVLEANGTSSGYDSPKLIIDLSLNINETKENVQDIKKTPQRASPPLDVPERDYDRPGATREHELLSEFSTVKTNRCEHKSRDFDLKGAVSRNPFPNLPMTEDGPSSLSAKSFTGSLNDIHTDSMKESQKGSQLIRQRSYTLLKPGPQLLAHLEVQSLSTGVAISCISMSESLSNLSTPNKKRRSWDLESAKVKWSSMAMELKQKNLASKVTQNGVKSTNTKTVAKKSSLVSPPRARSVALEKSRQENLSRSLPKSEPAQKSKKTLSPVRNAANKNNVKELHARPAIQNVAAPAKQATPLISESEDPATRVRELYERIQKQQLLQMATLVEKQKREQMMLQQVFEEQNNLLYNQLKTICPKSPDDKQQDAERGPVSLSQLINHKLSPDQSFYDSSVSSTLTDTSQYISHCDDMLKKSRDITGSIKKTQPTSRSQNGTKVQSPSTPLDGSRTRTHSPARNTSRRLNYDTSASSDREYEPVLTDRTNDTMADLNVTFPSDNSGDFPNNNMVMNNLCIKEMAVVQTSPPSTVSANHCRTESTLKSLDRPIHHSARSNSRAIKPKVYQPPTAKERAAATKIVAVAKGYLVRRLMRTERVQGIVQTIRDALLCALQLHQDREGIRGADVDLHRRLIQQITAACYTLHDTFVTRTPAERCAMIASDRGRRRSLAARQTPKPFRQTDLMSQSHTGAFPPRNKRPTSTSLMTQSNYETFSGKYTSSRSRYMPSPRRRPWR